ncbi:hypothetical protein BGZ46_003157, partial [Entomortierella lignicola]
MGNDGDDEKRSINTINNVFKSTSNPFNNNNLYDINVSQTSAITAVTSVSTIATATASIVSTTPPSTTNAPPPSSTVFNSSPLSPRPLVKPPLLTDYEYNTYWDPNPESLRLGVLLPFSASPEDRDSALARKGLSVIRMAVENVNRQQIIPGLNMSIILRDSQDPSLITSTGGAAAISAAGSLISAKISGVIGDLESQLTVYEALMTSSVQISQCSYASSSTALSSANVYPYFYRTIPTVLSIIDAMFAYINYVGWQRVSIIYDVDTLGFIGNTYIQDKAKSSNVYVLAYQAFNLADPPDDPSYSAIRNMIQSTESRIQLLISTGRLQHSVLSAMRDAGFMEPMYAWITINDISDQIQQEKNPRDYDGIVMVDNGWNLQGYPPYDQFLAQWMSLNSTEYPGAADPALVNNEAMAYSCVLMLANAYRS